MTNHPHRSKRSPPLTRYCVSTPVRMYGATIWDAPHSDMVAARTLEEAMQIARSRLRRRSYELGESVCQELGPCE